MEIISNAGKLSSDFNISRFSKYALDIYSSINHEIFDTDIKAPFYWKDCVEIIVNKYGQNSKVSRFNESIDYIDLDDNRVVIAFSGGLDSCYQALKLREEGYDVILLHICNLNKYTNGQEKKVVLNFAKRFNFSLELVNFKATPKDKYWPENSFKTALCYAVCMDYCIENGIKNISSGDDLRLSIDDTVIDLNLGDCYQITEAVFKDLPFNFIPIEVQDKISRLTFLDKYDARDYYYSCVAAGRLNQYLHNKYEEKYNIKLDKYSCGCGCRKDAMHCLQLHYFNGVDYPQEFIDRCWKIMAKGADEPFFGKDIELEKRIQNLVDY